MELVKEINYKKRNWRRDVGILAMMLGAVLIGIDLWLEEFLAATWIHATVAAVIVFPLHELAHGLLFKIWTGKVKFGAGLAKFGPFLYASSPGALLLRNRMLLIALVPQVLTVVYLGLSYLPLVEPVRIVLTIAGVLNFGGGVGDFYCIVQMLRYSKELRVEDSPMGLRFYMPEKEATSESIESVS